MGVGGVQSINPVLLLTGLGASPSSGRTSSGGSGFGPAALFGGSAPNFMQGLYNSVGTLINLRRPQLSKASAVESPAVKKRRQTLDAAAKSIAAGDTRGGRESAQSLLDKNPRDVSALHLIGRSYLAERDYRKAEKYISRALALAPSSTRLRSDLNDLRTLKKGDREVLAVARRKLKSPAHLAEALRLLFNLTDRNEHRAEAYLSMSDGFMASRRPVEALGALDAALKAASGDQLSQVIQRAEQAAKQYSNVGLPHNILGEALHRAGEFDRAIRELKTAADIAPENVSYVHDLADAYVDRSKQRLAAGKTDQARADVDAAARIDPANDGLSEASARIAADRAKRHIAGGRYAQALAELNTATTNAPDDPSFKKKLASLHTQVAAHFLNDGDEVQARTSYTRAYDLDPDNAVARRKMAELSHTQGLAELNDKDYDEAIALLERSYQAYRADDAYRQDLAQAYDARGQQRLATSDTDGAIEDFQRGVALDPANLAILANLSDALGQA